MKAVFSVGVFAALWLAVTSAAAETTKGQTTSSSTTTSQWNKVRHAWGAFADVLLGTHKQQKQQQQAQPKPLHGLQVLGAGFPRTGTKSIETALRRLGHKIYDPCSVLQHNHQARWVAAVQGWKNNTSANGLLEKNLTELELLVEDMEAEGYTATLDMPPYLLAEPLAALRPNAKVLLSIRDSTEQWYQSYLYQYHFLALHVLPPFCMVHARPYLQRAHHEIGLGHIDAIDLWENWEYVTRVWPWYDVIHLNPLTLEDHRQAWMMAHDRFVQEIKDSPIIRGTPTDGGASDTEEEKLESEESEESAVKKKDHLLVFNVKQGWDPLLSFLEVNDDDLAQALRAEGFPHVNDRHVLEMVRQTMHLVGVGFPLWILLALWMVWLAVSGCLRLIRLLGRMVVGSSPDKTKSKSD